MCCRKNKTVGCAVRTENTIQEDIHGAHGAPYNQKFLDVTLAEALSTQRKKKSFLFVTR